MTTFNCVYTFNNHSLCQHSKPHTKKKINARGSACTLRERSKTKKKKTPYPPPISFGASVLFHLCLFVNPCLLQQTLFFFLCSFLDFPVEFFFFFFILDFGFLPNLLFFFFFFFLSFLFYFVSFSLSSFFFSSSEV